MHGNFGANAALLRALKAQLAVPPCDVIVCPPAVYLAQCRAALDGARIGWGAQDVSAHTEGAHTGELSASMLADAGCSHVLVGHSEPRSRHGQTDRIVYGGSMKPENAAALLAMPDIDGGLIGGASLQADSFRAIVQAAA